jgi:AcrR family transcriptional regulator
MRLVAAARRVLYEQGVEKATLADIAAAAEGARLERWIDSLAESGQEAARP